MTTLGVVVWASYLLLLAQAEKDAFVVQPVGAACLPPSAVYRALARQFESHERQTGSWTISYRDDSDTALIVEVTDPMGTRRAHRRVKFRAGGCVASADAVAAIALSAVHPVGWTPDDRDESAVAVDAIPTVVRPEDKARNPGLRLGAGAAVLSGPHPGANLLFDADLRIHGSLRGQLGVFALPMHAEEGVGRSGTARLTRVTGYGGVGWETRFADLDWELGPALGVSLDMARTEGLTEPGSSQRLALYGGPLLAASLPRGDTWRIGLAAALFGRLAVTDFAVDVDGRQTLALSPSLLTGFLAIRMVWTP